MIDDELRSMVLDYMNKGFLENIGDMFRHDESLFPLVVDMLLDERVRVRLGAAALVEELAPAHRPALAALIPSVAALLHDDNPTVRADAAYVLGLIGHPDALEHLRSALGDPHPQVREIVAETIAELSSLSS